ncbi:hypothetical protein ACJVDH_13160 [Pedobacter sp. AW1-32]|uniref:hypothetical protein n=1 Tax=Pedobacter sp. AW1-32 TaxID=3383026 RepID=UPI003FEE652B
MDKKLSLCVAWCILHLVYLNNISFSGVAFFKDLSVLHFDIFPVKFEVLQQLWQMAKEFLNLISAFFQT